MGKSPVEGFAVHAVFGPGENADMGKRRPFIAWAGAAKANRHKSSQANQRLGEFTFAAYQTGVIQLRVSS